MITALSKFNRLKNHSVQSFDYKNLDECLHCMHEATNT